MNRQPSSWEKCSEWLADETSIPKKVFQNLGSLVEDYPHGLEIDQLQEAYEARFGYDLDFSNYGFISLSKLIDDLPSILRRVKSKSGYEKLFAAKRPVSDWERKFEGLGDVLDVLSNDVKEKITKIFENHEQILMEDFLDTYANAYDCTIDPTEFGYSDMKELLNRLDGKLLLIVKTDGKAYLEKLARGNECNPGAICDLGILQKTMKRSDFPEDAVTPHDVVNYLDWHGEVKVGDTVPIIVTSLRQHHVAPLIIFQLFKYKDAMDDLSARMNEFYLNCSDDWILPSNIAVSGMFCAAPFATEGYNRAQIVGKLYNGNIKIYNVDFGEISTISRRKLRYLKSEFATMPMMATEGILEGSTDYNWYKGTYSTLRDLTFYGHIDDICATFVENNTGIDNKEGNGFLFVFKLTVNGKDVMESLKESKCLNDLKKPEVKPVSVVEDPGSAISVDLPASLPSAPMSLASTDEPSYVTASGTEADEEPEDFALPFPEVPPSTYTTTTPYVEHQPASVPPSTQVFQQYSVPYQPGPANLYESYLAMLPPYAMPAPYDFSNPMVPQVGYGYQVPPPSYGFMSPDPFSAGWGVPYHPLQQPPYPLTAFQAPLSVPPGFAPIQQPSHSTVFGEIPESLHATNPTLGNANAVGPLQYSTPVISKSPPSDMAPATPNSIQEAFDAVDDVTVVVPSRLSSEESTKAGAEVLKKTVPSKGDIQSRSCDPTPQNVPTANGSQPPRVRLIPSSEPVLQRRPRSHPPPNWNTEEDIVEVMVLGNKLHKVMIENKPFFILEEVLSVFPECVIKEGDEKDINVIICEPFDDLPSHIIKELTSKNLIAADNEWIAFINCHEFPRFYYVTNGNKADMFAVTLELFKINIAPWEEP